MSVTVQRPQLRSIPLADVIPARPGACFVTMSADQWDVLLAEAYAAGWTLLEIGDDEVTPVRAYRLAQAHEVN